MQEAYVAALHKPREDRALADLARWSASAGSTGQIIDLEPYESCRVAAVVRRLRLEPVEGYIDVVVSDGTAELVARWALRPRPPQLAAAPRQGILLEGVPMVGAAGDLIMLEPGWRLIEAPAELEIYP